MRWQHAALVWLLVQSAGCSVDRNGAADLFEPESMDGSVEDVAPATPITTETSSDPQNGDDGPEAEAEMATASVPAEGLLLWLSADVGVGEALGHVEHWRDRSSEGHDAVQPDSQAEPVILTDWHAGKPAVQFDGAAQFLKLPPSFNRFPDGLSIFVVGDMEDGIKCPSFIAFSNGGEMDDISLHIEDNASFAYEVKDDVLFARENTAPARQALLLEVIHGSDGEVRLFAGGASSGQQSFAVPSDVTRAMNDIGRSSYPECDFLKGHVAEVVVYRRALDDAERAMVEGYLKAKWGL